MSATCGARTTSTVHSFRLVAPRRCGERPANSRRSRDQRSDAPGGCLQPSVAVAPLKSVAIARASDGVDRDGVDVT
jgi:hypothetical protein